MSKRKSLTPEDAPLSPAPGLFEPTEPPAQDPKPAGGRRKRNEAEYARRYGRPTTYRLPVELRDRLRDIAKAEGVGLSDLAELALALFVTEYDAGKVGIPKRLRPAQYAIDFDALER